MHYIVYQIESDNFDLAKIIARQRYVKHVGFPPEKIEEIKENN